MSIIQTYKGYKLNLRPTFNGGFAMSGICGIIYFDKKLVENEIEIMIESLAHRGNDGVGVFKETHVGMAHLMRHVTYESVYEKQPIVTSSGCICVADARIDNRTELIEVLNLKPTPHRSITDSELILAAYEYWGESCGEHLIGDFAIVIWNPQDQKLLLLRDHMGVRPLFYYYKQGYCLAFASEVGALLRLPFVPNELNESKISLYLCWLSDFRMYSNETYYNQIYSLEPAHQLLITQNHLQKKFIWHFDPQKYAHLTTENDFLEAFKETFIEAVRCRIRTPYGVSSHLSGGLDSSSVSVIARDILKKRNQTLHTVYMDVQHPEADEKAYAQSVVNGGGIFHEWVTAKNTFEESSRWLMQANNTPDSSVVPAMNHLAIADAIANNGSRVALTGHEGDTIVGHGKSWIMEVLRQRQWQAFKVAVSSVVDIFDKKGPEKELFYKQYTHEYIGYLLREYIHQKKFRALLSLIISAYQNLDYIPSLEQLNKGVKKLFFTKTPKNQLPLHSCLSNEKANSLYQSNLFLRQFQWPTDMHPAIKKVYSGGIIEQNESFNNVSTRKGFIYTHPFLDKRLIELCAVIPTEINFDNGALRGTIRKGLKDYLPYEIVSRKTKINFSGHQVALIRSLSSYTTFPQKDILIDWVNQQKYFHLLSKIQNEVASQEALGVLRVIYLNDWLNKN